MTHRFIPIIVSIIYCMGIYAQEVTYNHDDSKMNQITVMEMGYGTLTPELWYEILHNGYKKSAAEKNKSSLRSLAGVQGYQQISYSEEIDSAMTKRGKVEALNVADREVDIAWTAEGGKIESKLNDFKKNIERIVYAGGSSSDQIRWTEYYNMFTSAIAITKGAYMPNAQRKKEYLRIYDNICKENETLLKYITRVNSIAKTRDYLSSRLQRNKDFSSQIKAAHDKWTTASHTTNKTK